MERTIIYARVSTEDQVEKYGIPLQLRACREFAKSRSWQVIEEITDDGISGTILSRPGLDRARQLVASGQADHLLMVDVDRLSREVVHLLILKRELEKKATLDFVAGKFEDSPSGRLFFGIRGVIAQYERENTRERTMRGKREKVLSGKVLGGRVAYGYLYEKGSGVLTIDEGRAPIVREIFQRFVAGESVRGLARYLRSVGAPTWGGSGQWGQSSVRRILENETYGGVAHYGRHQWTEDRRLVKRAPGPHLVPIVVPAIVPHETWESAERRLRENALAGRPSTAFLFRSLLYCACGSRMCGERSKKTRSYRCTGRDPLRHRGPLCRVSIATRTLDDLGWRALLDTFTDGGTLRAILAKRQNELQDSASPDRIEALECQARKLRARAARAMALMLDADMAEGKAELKAAYLAAQRERQSVEAELAGLRAVVGQAESGESWLDEAVAAISHYLPALESPEERQAIVKRLVTRADWDGKQLKMHCLFGAEMYTSSAYCGLNERLEFVVTARLAA